MFSLSLPAKEESGGSAPASARRVAPVMSSRVLDSSRGIQAGKSTSNELPVHAQDDEQSSDYDSSLDDLDLLYTSDSHSDSYTSDEATADGGDEGDEDDDEKEAAGRGADSPTSSSRSTSEDGNDDVVRDEHRPPRLSLPSLPALAVAGSAQTSSLKSTETTSTHDEGREREREWEGKQRSETARRVQFRAMSTSHEQGAQQQQGQCTVVKVGLLTPCFDLTIANGEDPAVQVAEKFAVGQERVRVLMHEEDRVAVELLGSSFSLAKLEEKMAENATLHARVEELERKLTSSESLRLKAHRALQELRREVDALENLVCSNKK